MTQLDDPVVLTSPSREDFVERARDIGQAAAPHAEEHDRASTFVVEGYRAIRELHYGAMAVPLELGGDGADVADTCAAQRELGRWCASTGLAIAMHQHTVLSLAWRWREGLSEIGPFMRRLVDEDLIMASSGTLDPANPALIGRVVDGGLILSGQKRLASGSPNADILFSLAGDDGGEWIWNVAVPMDADGLTVVDDWYGMGMRGSGSNTVRLEDAFVPDANLFMRRRRPAPRPNAGGQARAAAAGGNPADRMLDRPPIQGPVLNGLAAPAGRQRRFSPVPRGATPGVRMPGLMIALTVISASYLGVADDVHDKAIEAVRGGRRATDPVTHRLLGEMHAAWRRAAAALEEMIDGISDDALGTEELFRTVMICKRELVTGAVEVAEKAMEAVGSASYMQGSPFERALRDVRAAVTHPLPPAAALSEVGRSLLMPPPVD
jgi:alkylation response protein AidB-like acyl-CoA dehydrogenase